MTDAELEILANLLVAKLEEKLALRSRRQARPSEPKNQNEINGKALLEQRLKQKGIKLR